MWKKKLKIGWEGVGVVVEVAKVVVVAAFIWACPAGRSGARPNKKRTPS